MLLVLPSLPIGAARRCRADGGREIRDQRARRGARRLKRRLAATRWPDEIANAGWERGTNLAYLRALADYWRNGYDWRRQEAALNRLPQYRIELDGLRIHFVHVRGKGAKPLPLIISHGWPGSFVEMARLIPLLADPAAHGGSAEDAFDVVVPSLPGYGFSDRPLGPGMNPNAIARYGCC